MRHESPFIGRFTIDSACGLYLRLKNSATAGILTIAGDEDFLGVAEIIAYASGDAMTLYQRDVPGTQCYVGNGVITAGDWVSTAAAGKVQSGTGGARVLGKALNTTTVDGEQVEVLPLSSNASVARSSLAQQDLVKYPIPLASLRVWDAPGTPAVAATAANDDLAIVYNTFLTANATVEGGDVKGASSARKVGFQFTLPPEYVAGETITARLKGGMKTTVAGTSCSIDLQVARAAAPTVDVCATALQTINSLTAANKDFTITPTDCIPGDVFDCVVTIAYVDAVNSTAVVPQWLIEDSGFLLDIKG